MQEVNYISHIFETNVEEIKALALYFDQINIVEQQYKQVIGNKNRKDKYGKSRVKYESKKIFTHPNFKSHLKDFQISKVVKYSNAPNAIIDTQNSLKLVSSDHQINGLVLDNLELIGKKGVETPVILSNGLTGRRGKLTFNEESNEVIQTFFPKSPNKDNGIIMYYGALIETFVTYYEQGKNVLTSSNYINNIFQEINKTQRFKEVQKTFKSELNVAPSFAFEAIKIGVPNLGKFPPQAILEFKSKSKDELLAFEKTLESITLDLLSNYDQEYIMKNAQKIADLKIKPLVDNISKSLDISSFRVLQELVKEAKDPKSYAPLLLTFSEHISNTLALFISLGFVSISAGLEHFSNYKDAKKDGVYYLYKMNKHFI